MRCKSFLFFSGVILILSSILVFSSDNAPPEIPMEIWGTATYNGTQVVDGLTVKALSNGADYAQISFTKDGYYDVILINGDRPLTYNNDSDCAIHWANDEACVPCIQGYGPDHPGDESSYCIEGPQNGMNVVLKINNQPVNTTFVWNSGGIVQSNLRVLQNIALLLNMTLYLGSNKNHSAIVTVQMLNKVTSVFSQFNITTDFFGLATVQDIPEAMYDIAVKPQYCLRKRINDTAVSTSNSAKPFGYLYCGDFYEDNEVNSLDISGFSGCYGKNVSSYPDCKKADFYQDGTINVFDIGPFSGSYGRLGDPEIVPLGKSMSAQATAEPQKTQAGIAAITQPEATQEATPEETVQNQTTGQSTVEMVPKCACKEDNECHATKCDALDGCVDNDYHDYNDQPNSCIDCQCTNALCANPNVTRNDPRCLPQNNDVTIKATLSGKNAADISVQLLNKNSLELSAFDIKTDESGEAQLENIPSGEYDIAIKPAYYLRKRINHIIIGTSTTYLEFGSFKTGDLNNDNKVNKADLSAFSHCYAKDISVFPECKKADFNGDGAVNSLDLSVLSGSYGKVGDAGISQP